MKKILSVFMILVFLLSLSISAAAYGGVGIPDVPKAQNYAGFTNLPVYDGAGVLSDYSYNQLSNSLEITRVKHGIDVAFVTTSYLVSGDAQSSADDIYDYADYGYGSNKEGILFYVCVEERVYALSTYGENTFGIFNDDALIYIEEQFMPYLTNSDFEGAAKAYADACDELLQLAAEGKTFKPRKSAGSVILTYAIALGIAFLIAFVLTKSKLSQMKTAVARKEANDYVKKDSMNITFARDLFLYSNIIRTPRPKESSGSSTTKHTSSSGRSHGGRSGRF